MELSFFNPWWRDGRVPEALTGKERKIFRELVPYIDARQIVLLTGLRRVGKTTLLYRLIDTLIKQGISPYNILYFSFDEKRYDLNEIVSRFESEVLRKDIAKGKVFLFFDEIQKLPEWTSKIKLLYDTHPDLKIFLSGSAQITMWKGTRESLAGRFFDFFIRPLDFDEYLEFKGVYIDKDREAFFEKDLKIHMRAFLRTGGFIEAINMEEDMLRKYLKESLLERVVFIDVPQAFRLGSPDLLMKLLSIAASRPGLYLDYRNLSNDLDIDQRTIANYISYLEYALFFQKLFNYSRNLLTSEKKVKRLYLSNTGFTLALNPQVELPHLLEQFFVNIFKARFFVRTPQKDEIDIIHTKGPLVLPVEIKIREKIGKAEVKPLFRFLVKNNLQRSLLISLDTETVINKDGLRTDIIPYWKYWSIQKQMTLA